MKINNFALLHNVKICKCTGCTPKGAPQFGNKQEGTGISEETLRTLLEGYHEYQEPGKDEEAISASYSSGSSTYEDDKPSKSKSDSQNEDGDSDKTNTHAGYSYKEAIRGDLFDASKADLSLDALSKKEGCPANARCYAGNHYDKATVTKNLQKRSVDEAARALLLLIERECGNGIYDSPRFCSEKLVSKLKTNSLTSLTKIKKEEMHRKRLLVVCDVSGSCSTVCNEMAAACYKLIEYDDRICIMFISNDGPWKILGDGVDDGVTLILEKLNKILNGDYGTGYDDQYSENQFHLVQDLFQELVNYLCLKAAIGFGDDHPRQTFRALAATGIDMFYFANQNISTLRKVKTDKKLTDQERKDAVYFAVKRYLNNWKVLPKLVVDGISDCKKATDAVIDYLTTGEGKVHQNV